MTNLHHHCGLGSRQAFDFGLQQLLFGLGVTHVRPVLVSSFVSSLRSARSRLAGALALTVALLSMMLASPAALARRHQWDRDRIIRFNQPGAGGEQLLLLPRRRQQRPAVESRRLGGRSGQYGAWAPIGAEQTASGYQVAWKVAAPISTQPGAPTATAISSPTGPARVSGIERRAEISSKPVSIRI